MSESASDDQLRALALADLGQKVLNAIAATSILGHTNMRHTLTYVHTDDSASALVNSIIDGRIDRAVAAHKVWAESALEDTAVKYGLNGHAQPISLANELDQMLADTA